MNLHLLTTPLLATLLLLSTLGCSRKDAAPEPALEGSWDLTSSTTATYVAGKTQLSQFTTTFPVGNNAAARYYTFTSTTRQLFANAGGTSGSVETYSRSGNVLTFYMTPPGSSTPLALGNQTITQLTTTNLTLFSTENSSLPPYGYTTYENQYTRR